MSDHLAYARAGCERKDAEIKHLREENKQKDLKIIHLHDRVAELEKDLDIPLEYRWKYDEQKGDKAEIARLHDVVNGAIAAAWRLINSDNRNWNERTEGLEAIIVTLREVVPAPNTPSNASSHNPGLDGAARAGDGKAGDQWETDPTGRKRFLRKKEEVAPAPDGKSKWKEAAEIAKIEREKYKSPRVVNDKILHAPLGTGKASDDCEPCRDDCACRVKEAGEQ